MKPAIVADEMFPEGAGFMDLEECSQLDAGGPSGMLMDLAIKEKYVHADFYNNFDDLFDEDEEVSNFPSHQQQQQQQPQQQQQQQQPSQQLQSQPQQQQHSPSQQ